MKRKENRYDALQVLAQVARWIDRPAGSHLCSVLVLEHQHLLGQKQVTGWDLFEATICALRDAYGPTECETRRLFPRSDLRTPKGVYRCLLNSIHSSEERGAGPWYWHKERREFVRDELFSVFAQALLVKGWEAPVASPSQEVSVKKQPPSALSDADRECLELACWGRMMDTPSRVLVIADILQRVSPKKRQEVFRGLRQRFSQQETPIDDLTQALHVQIGLQIQSRMN